MGEFSTRADVTKNRVYLTISGYLTLDQAQDLKNDYQTAVSKCRPGFTVLTTVTDYKPGSQEVQDMIASCAQIDDVAGCRKVARVTGNKPLGVMQIDRVVSSVATYPAQHFASPEEAEAWLDTE